MSINFKAIQNSLKIEFSHFWAIIKKYKWDIAFYFFLVLVGLLFFSVSLVTNMFTTPFGGDYVVQMFSFYTNGYDDWWHFFKTGEFILYDTNTFLGANNISCNSFYYLSDPFFFPILLFPREFVPQGMAVLTIFKMATGGIAFYVYIRKFNVSKSSSRVASTMYAFCGWVTWYLWFNFFTEIIICFPLILLGVEKVLKKETPFLLIASIALVGFVNYFFMFTLVLCAFIYAIVRYFQRFSLNNVKENLKILGIGAISFIIGLMICSVIVIPSALEALTSDRASGSDYIPLIKDALKNNRWDLILNYLFTWQKVDGGRDYRSLFPIIEFFYPVTSDRGTPLTKFGNETYDNIAGSLFCYTPSMILLVPALIRSCRQKKWSHLAIALAFILFLFTPFAYYLMHGFTKPYSRWTLFVTICLIAYIGIYLDKIKDEPKWSIILGGLFALSGIIVGAFVANHIVTTESNFTERVPIFLVMGIALLEASLVFAVIFFVRKKPKFSLILNIIVALEAIAMGTFTIFGHGLSPYVYANNRLDNNNALYALTNKMNKDDRTYYRSYSGITGDSAKNDGMRNDFNSASFFHSVYNFNVKEFLDWSSISGSKNGWSGVYVEKRLNLDTFLGMKYYYILKENLEYERLGQTYRPNVPFNYVDISSEYPSDKYYVYENKNHIDFAFSYDTVMPYNSEKVETFFSLRGNFSTIAIEELYLKHGILDYLDAKEVATNHPDISLQPINGSPKIEDAKYLSSGSYNSSTQYSIEYYQVPEGKVKTSSFEQIKNAYLSGNKITRPDENNGKVFIVLENRYGSLFPYDPEGVVFYLNLPYKLNNKYDVYLLDENNNLITMDKHSDNYVTNNNGRKLYRAFYLNKTIDNNGNVIPAPKLKTIIYAPRYYQMYLSYPLAYETYTTFNNSKMNEIRQYPIENVIYKTNYFSFTTNYPKERFICTQLAYDDGWKVFATNKDGVKEQVKTYKAQGGFVSFVSKKGYTSYEMIYETPYLQISKLISSIGIVLYASTILGYYYIDVELKKKKIINDLHF